jgi:archaemetzincin
MKFSLFLLFGGLMLLACSENRQKKLAIQPFGNFDSVLVDSVLVSIEKTYGFSVTALPHKVMPRSAFVNVKSPRYRADTINRILWREKDDEYDYILGLTAFDISSTKKYENGNVLKPAYKYEDWGIMGLGFCPGESCIVSTFRLKTTDEQLLMERLKKCCNHEIGHNLGLPHCKSSDKCVMKDAAESIKTVDNVELVLCDECASKIE